MSSFVRRAVVAAGLTVFGLAGCSNTEGPVSATMVQPPAKDASADAPAPARK